MLGRTGAASAPVRVCGGLMGLAKRWRERDRSSNSRHGDRRHAEALLLDGVRRHHPRRRCLSLLAASRTAVRPSFFLVMQRFEERRQARKRGPAMAAKPQDLADG